MKRALKIAVVTPVHPASLPYLEETSASLDRQTDQDFEWIVVPNGGATLPSKPYHPLTHSHPTDLRGIGALKRFACEKAREHGADVLVELDADDLLVPTAIARIRKAFERGADVVYSDFAEFRGSPPNHEVSWAGYPYGPDFGWTQKAVKTSYGSFVAMKAPEATAHNLRRVEWAPNHVRAWRTVSYGDVGGHDPAFEVGDDHDLLVRLFLAGKKFTKIDRCLYLYRVHGENTVSRQNAAIQEATGKVYNRTIWALGEKFTADRGLKKVDLCGGIDSPPGYLALDKSGGDGVLACDLEGTWPLPDSSVGLLRAHDALEHLKDPIHTMNEAFRVLAPGGFFMISVPSTNGLGAWCDPTHCSFWNKLSFRYYTNKHFARYIPAFKGRFQTSRVIEWFPSDWHEDENVPYVEAHLFCAKDGFRAMGEWGWG